MPDEQGNTPDLRLGMIARAAIPQRLDQLEDALNETAKRAVGALAEAAMARQETAAQSQRIDRAHAAGENTAKSLRAGLAEQDLAYDKRCDALSKRIDTLEAGLLRLSTAVGNATLSSGKTIYAKSDDSDMIARMTLIRDLQKLQDSTQSGSWQWSTIRDATERIRRG